MKTVRYHGSILTARTEAEMRSLRRAVDFARGQQVHSTTGQRCEIRISPHPVSVK